MKIIITSDSHGRNSILDLIPYYYEDADLFLNCGDLEDNPSLYDKWIFISGNNDIFYIWDMPETKIVTAGNHRIFMIHSDQCYPTYRKKYLVTLAKNNDCDIVCYGHTHVSDIDIVDGILLINPGSLRLPRDGKSCSYCVLTIEGDKLFPEIIFEEDWPF